MSQNTLQKPANAKAGRRARIIQEAHKMIARSGYEGLSLRKLASAADVTVPTIYNLIGPKEKILVELFRVWIHQIETTLDTIEKSQPLDVAESIITEAIDLIQQDQTFFRAAHIAMTHLMDTDPSQKEFEKLGRKASNMQTAAVRDAQKLGLLVGRIPAETLGRHIYFNYSEASRYWTFGKYNLSDFRNTALNGVYLAFLSDTSDDFRPEIMRRLNQMKVPKI